MSVLASASAAFAASIAVGMARRYSERLQQQKPSDPSNLRSSAFEVWVYWSAAFLLGALFALAIASGGLWWISCFLTGPLGVLLVVAARGSSKVRLRPAAHGFEYTGWRAGPKFVAWSEISRISRDSAMVVYLHDGSKVRVSESIVGFSHFVQRVLEHVPAERLSDFSSRSYHAMVAKLHS